MSGRIGKVRMKDSGFEFRVIHGPAEPETDVGARLHHNARAFASEGNLVGYMIVGLYGDGTYDTALSWNDNTSPIPRTLMPSYVADIVRRELLGQWDAANTFDSMFQWVE